MFDLVTEMSNGVLTVKVLAPIDRVTFVGGVPYCETVPKSSEAAFVPEPPSVTPLPSVTNVRLMELASSADTAKVPELVVCAPARPDIRIKLAKSAAD